jgi:hypothetical protein
VFDENTIVAIAEVLLKRIAIGPRRKPCCEVGVLLRCVVGVRHDDKLLVLTWMRLRLYVQGWQWSVKTSKITTQPKA